MYVSEECSLVTWKISTPVLHPSSPGHQVPLAPTAHDGTNTTASKSQQFQIQWKPFLHQKASDDGSSKLASFLQLMTLLTKQGSNDAKINISTTNQNEFLDITSYTKQAKAKLLLGLPPPSFTNSFIRKNNIRAGWFNDPSFKGQS